MVLQLTQTFAAAMSVCTVEPLPEITESKEKSAEHKFSLIQNSLFFSPISYLFLLSVPLFCDIDCVTGMEYSNRKQIKLKCFPSASYRELCHIGGKCKTLKSKCIKTRFVCVVNCDAVNNVQHAENSTCENLQRNVQHV